MDTDLTRSYKLGVTEEEIEVIITALQFVNTMTDDEAARFFGDRGVSMTDGRLAAARMQRQLVRATEGC